MAKLVTLGTEDIGYDLVALIEHLNNPKAKLPTESDEDGEEKEEETAKGLYGNSALGKLVAQKKHGELIQKGFIPAVDTLFKGSPQDIDTAFSICFFIVQNYLDAQSAAKILPLLVQSLSKDTSSHTELKLRLLTVAFNMADTASRYTFFVTLLKFAVASGNSAMLAAQISEVETWLASWNLKSNDLSELYLLLATVVRSSGKRGPTQKYLLKYLKNLEKPESKSDKTTYASAKPHVISAAVNAIQNKHRNALVHTDKLLGSAVVKSLSDDKDAAPLIQLLRIFATDSVQAYLTWASSNKEIISKHGLDNDANLKKIRTLTICSIGMTQEKIPLDLLKEKLVLPDAMAVESAVFDAVVSGLLAAKVDQEHDVVVIQRVIQRSFDVNDWKVVHEKLSSWQASVNQVLTTLHSAQDRLRPQTAVEEPLPEEETEV